MTTPSRVLIDVFIPQSTDIEAVATTVDLSPNPGGAQVILVPSLGPPGPPGPSGAAGDGVQRLTAIALGGHRLVVPDDTGAAIYADAQTVAHANRPLWLTTSAWSAGVTATLVGAGVVTEPSWSWTPGLPIFVGLNGLLTQTIPMGAAFIRIAAQVVNATTLYFGASAPIIP